MLAGAGALVTGEILGRVVPGAVSPVVAIGNRVVGLAPPQARDAGVNTFGTLDKPLLVGGILLVVVGLSVFLGGLAERRRVLAETGVAGLALVAALAVVPDVAGTLVGAMWLFAGMTFVGVALLRLLATTVPASAQTPVRGVDRRHFLVRAGLAGVGVLGAGGLLKVLDVRAQVAAVRDTLALPVPVRRAPGDPLAVAFADTPGLTPLVTANAGFYRIDTALVVPQVSPVGWTLTIDGLVDTPLTLTYADLMAMPQVEADITIQCVSNEVGGDLVGLARWQGVLLRDVLAKAGVQAGAGQVVGESVDGFTAGFPLSYGTDDRFAMIALGMNGEPLPVVHGFPARLIVPGLYGYVSATKWLQSIHVTTWEGFDGFWIPRGWSKEGPIKIASRIDVPAQASTLPAGDVTVAGMAWAPGRGRGVTAVEVRVDGGAWKQAELGGALSENAWRQWRWTWPATPGAHRLEVRATDRKGDVQTGDRAEPRPDGATGYHAVEVLVSGSGAT